MNFIAKEKKHIGINLDHQIVEIIAGHSGLDNSSPEMITKLLLEAIELLPEKQAIVFQLKYFEDLKYSEISTKLKTSEGALKANYHHAKNKIEEYILSQLNL